MMLPKNLSRQHSFHAILIELSHKQPNLLKYSSIATFKILEGLTGFRLYVNDIPWSYQDL
jgi:hypothetical protein